MSNKIFASLKDKTQVILFDEKSNDYNEIIKLFKYDIEDLKIVDFLKNLHCSIKEDEIYSLKISDDDEKIFFSDILLNNNSVDNNKAIQNQYKEIDVIYLVNTQDKKVYLKKIYPTQHVGAKKLLGYGDLGPTYKEEPDKISLSSKVHVCYDIKNKTFYFKNFNNLKSIFNKVVKFYREATKEEAQEFFSGENFELKDTILDNTTNKFRKRLGYLIDRKIDFSNQDLMKKYENYAKKHNHNLKKDGDKYILKTKPQLETFMKIFEEVFYKTPITNEDREVENWRSNQNDTTN